MRLSRLVGILITAALLAASLSFWRSNATTRSPGAIRPERGGEITATLRSAVSSYNPLIAADPGTATLGLLTQGSLVRINRATFELEPWLAERWDTAPDGRTFTLHLRPGLFWSDGQPLTADDVVFSVNVVYDRRSASPLASSLTVAGQPIRVSVTDPTTVVFTYPASSGPGLRLLDKLTILPRHKLESALKTGQMQTAWDAHASVTDIVGTGPFVVREHEPGKRLVLERNAHYWRKSEGGDALPYLDRIVLDVVPNAASGMQRLQQGIADLVDGELPTDAYVAARRAEDQGALTVLDLGVDTNAAALWFSLKPDARRGDPRFVFTQKPQFRQAISHAVDRELLADEVFQSAAVPIWGPITPGNRQWFWASVPRYAYDSRRASALLKSIGLEDRNGNGVAEDERGTEARYTVLTRRGIEQDQQTMMFVRAAVARVGIALEVTPLEADDLARRVASGAYDAAYLTPGAGGIDPAENLNFWLSSGDAHVWDPRQRAPGTDWERRIDTIILEQAATPDFNRRRELFNSVQQILAENAPVLYFVAPRLYYAHAARLIGVSGSVLPPHALWNADSLAVTGPPRRPE